MVYHSITRGSKKTQTKTLLLEQQSFVEDLRVLDERVHFFTHSLVFLIGHVLANVGVDLLAVLTHFVDNIIGRLSLGYIVAARWDNFIAYKFLHQYHHPSMLSL